MKWLHVINDNTCEITAKELKGYLKSHNPETYQLIDVRQPKEYREHHLPGAVLIPLNTLSTRLAEITPSRDIIVYCRSGARSRAACQILSANHFPKVFNMKGGILTWGGQVARGSETTGLEYFVAGTFDSAFEMAYKLEKGLQNFYLSAAALVESAEGVSLLEKMARLEDGHMQKILVQARQHQIEIDFSKRTDILEGGLNPSDLIHTFNGELDRSESVIQLAMMFEAQAFDLYSRLAHNNRNTPLENFYMNMAREEQSHLDKLAMELDTLLV